eukprot:TRINITY_DN2263_c0_g1_i6.p1 TRINITY_DN2263_c0_g1~~TRINITY_DN2263_c0_g1_i6.p1  ORF type:complete len:286 (-),score=93.64 TRINITY_DN2263_c0_g1_i6:473-1330(-)
MKSWRLNRNLCLRWKETILPKKLKESELNNESMNKLVAELNDLRAKYQKAKTSLDEYAAKDALRESEKPRTTTEKETSNGSTSDVGELKRKNAELEAKIRDLNTLETSSQIYVADYKKKVEQYGNELQTLKSSNSNGGLAELVEILKKSVDELRQQVFAAHQKETDQEGRLAAIVRLEQEERTKLESTRNVLLHDLDGFNTSKLEQLYRSLADSRAENKNLDTIIRDMQDEFTATKIEVNRRMHYSKNRTLMHRDQQLLIAFFGALLLIIAVGIGIHQFNSRDFL